jgi:hypothetical protein
MRRRAEIAPLKIRRDRTDMCAIGGLLALESQA